MFLLLTDPHIRSLPPSLSSQASFGDGQVRLYIFKGRRVAMAGDDDPDRVSVVHYIDPCPASR